MQKKNNRNLKRFGVLQITVFYFYFVVTLIFVAITCAFSSRRMYSTLMFSSGIFAFSVASFTMSSFISSSFALSKVFIEVLLSRVRGFLAQETARVDTAKHIVKNLKNLFILVFSCFYYKSKLLFIALLRLSAEEKSV